MTSAAITVEQYLAELPEARQQPMINLRQAIVANLSPEFVEQMSYGMIGFVVPHSLYPAGYHCTPQLPLPFINLASQKNHIAVYHMGLYAMPSLLDWFTAAYQQQNVGKLDLGKSCIRFKNPDKIPFSLLGELAAKVSVSEWIAVYETNFKPVARQ
jgi:uncharacterized protein YdhG (YjbR/CyaY superfamily)